MLRRAPLILVATAFVLALLPQAQLPADAATRASGKVVARQVEHSMPAYTVGELRRQSGARIDAVDAGSTGAETLSVTSPVIDAGQLFERIGVQFRAARGTEDSMYVETRTSADSASWTDWRTMKIDEDLANEAANVWYASLQTVPASSRYAQYRVWLTAGDPAALEDVGVTLLDVNDLNVDPLTRFANDVRGALADVARTFSGDAGSALAAPTGAPKILTRQDWGADESLMQWTPKYVPVQKIVVHHTVTDDGGTNVAATIRGIYYYHAVTRGWGDIGYSYLVDKYGNIWTGRQGGDNTVAGHAYGWNDGTIGIASIGDYSVIAPTGQLQGALTNLISVKMKQLGIAPYGSSAYTHQEQKSDGSWINVTSTVANVLGHRDCNYVVGATGGQTACPGGALYGMLGGLRSQAQAAWQNGYTYLTRLDPQLPSGGFPGQQLTTTVGVTNLGTVSIPAGTAVNYKVLLRGSVVAQGAGAPLAQPVAPGGVAAVSLPFTAPAAGEYVVRWDLQSGGSWWNALYNDPVRDQWFRSADWSANWINDNVPRTWTAGETKQITVTVQNDGGRTWNDAGVDPVKLGYYWISTATGNKQLGANEQALPGGVAPGMTVTLTIPVTAPAYPTNYTMILDLHKQNEFWFKDKGPAPDDTPTNVLADIHATYGLPAQPPAFAAGTTATVPVTVTNTGKGIFPTTGSNPITLGYHWYDASGKIVVWDGTRSKLPSDLAAGQSASLQAQVTAPSSGGAFSLRFDLVQEGVGWFSQKGVGTANLTVNVSGPVVAVYGAAYQPGVTTLAQSGALAAIPFTVTNTSNFTWSPAGPNPVDLGYHWLTAAGQVLTWDGLRTQLTGDVAPGQSAVLQAQVGFPTGSGNYTLRWDMAQEGVTWFSGKGVKPFDQAVTVGAAAFYGGSMDVSQVPAKMSTNLANAATVRVQNMSSFTWDTNVNLSYHWYDVNGNAVVWDGARTSLAGMAPNEVRTVTATVLGPAQPGIYTLKLDVVQEGVTWFSSKGMLLAPIAVQVQTPALAAQYAAPASVTAATGTTAAVPITITNLGSTAWQPGAFNLAYHLYSGTGATVVWDGARTALPQPVGPGQAVALTATVQVPTTPGAYTVRWDLVQEGVAWFSGQSVTPGSSTLVAQ